MPKPDPAPTPEPTYDDRANPYTLDFHDGSLLTIAAPTYDERGRLPGKVEAWSGDALVNAGTIDLLSDHARQAFARSAALSNGKVEVAWLPRLLLLLSNVEQTLERQTPARSSTPAPLSFPTEALPKALRAYITAGAKALPCPADLIGVPMLSVLGTAIGDTQSLELKPGWRESAALWTAAIADTGTKKSPALHLAAQPLYDIQDCNAQAYTTLHAAYQADMATYEADMATWKSTKPAERGTRPLKPQPPNYTQVYSTDATIEALAGILEQNPNGVLFLRDELTGWASIMYPENWTGD